MSGTVSPQHNASSTLFQRIFSTLRAELRWIINSLMPVHCPLCMAELTPSTPAETTATARPPLLCPTCRSNLRARAPACCPRCDEPYISASTTNHLCPRCIKDPPAFIWLKTATIFNETAAQAVHQFKYNGKTTLAAALTQCMLQQLEQEIRAFGPQLIVPVPLHITRLRQRGYNQSLLLARNLARQLNLPIANNILKRTRATNSQTQLSARQRHHNLRNAFTCAALPRAQRILLVDDVVTTTATARACARALQAQGHSVAVVALARATLT